MPPRRPRSQPARFRQRPIPRQWRHRLEPIKGPRRRRGIPGIGTRLRWLFWSWPLWLAIAAITYYFDERGFTVGTAIGGLVAYLLAPREQPPAFGLDHTIDVDAPEFVPSLVGLTATDFIGGNRVTLLNNGGEFYPAMLDAVRGARESVTVEAYIYWQGKIGMEFARAFAERARAGCAVKILLDAVGSSTIGTEILKTLEEGGCQLAWFNPIQWYSFGRFNYRTHRKSLIIDGRLGFTGGAGIADHWQGHAQDEDHWRDMQVCVEGPGVLPLQTGFAQNWLITTRELVSGPRFFPLQTSAGDTPVHTMLSSPTSGASEARLLYLFAIVCSKQSVLIANPYFVPDPAAIDTLVDACRRGVKVQVVVSGRHNDNWLARNNSVRLFGRLLECGVEIYEYNRTMLHQKTLIVDGGFATIGTANFDNRSFAFNEESAVSFVDRSLLRSLEATFQQDLSASRRLTLDVWKRRGILARAQEFIAAFMEDQV